jgi:hypothetical protein
MRVPRMTICGMPIEYRGDVGCGDVFQPIVEKFNGDMP